MPGVAPAPATARRPCSSTQRVSGRIRPVLLGERDELVGREQPALRGAASAPAPRRRRRRPVAGRPWAGSAATSSLVARSRARSSATSARRLGAVRRRVGVVDAVAARGRSLATYIATSARWSSSSASSPCSGESAMPTLALDVERRAVERRTARSSASADARRHATRAPRRRRRRAGARRTRRRRGGRPCRRRRRRWQALAPICCSSWSPVWWPSVSLISLKRSRSMIRIARARSAGRSTAPAPAR